MLKTLCSFFTHRKSTRSTNEWELKNDNEHLLRELTRKDKMIRELRDRNSELYRDMLAARTERDEFQQQVDAWKKIAIEEKVGADPSESHLYKVAYVPMLAQWPFPEFFEGARLRTLQGGQIPEAIVRVLYRVGQFDDAPEE